MKHLPMILAAALLILGNKTHAQEIKKLIEWGWDEPDTKFMRQNVEKMETLPFDFVDGMLDACTPQTRFVDAWEGAYTYKKKEQFDKAYDNIKVKLAPLAADREKYHRHFTAGFGIWMDCDWNKVGWHTDDLSKNYFSPAEFENTVRLGLQRTDEYVWIYSEQPRWWTNEKLPPAYVEALKAAKK